ncbi:DUF4156 domain-containing protein [Nitrosomonas sp. JL21]|uniref:DUF4156 domain-containing protein n=1 Tax=Nitrosomonas sp. JL21 TaxID=153949 RepID=UPI00136F8EF1|nr:DUF4156 domain-containing protein [Nitrosomonas sp. JL21]MBL8497408.1 DUF4156 domain-containing protein [Nitrosomonas sp.]MCC7090521.1 DUF4156 domain-containing protein [Nitrosomonas sp.]MXS78706.1 DUF4156 domain-containing protein [Nitrosomonas sp. JL21]
MNRSRKMNPLLKNTLYILLVMGCSEISAQPDVVKPVVIVVGDQNLEGCESLGKVRGSSSENESADDDAPYVERLIKARNHLRAEAQKLGANTVHIINSNTSGKYEVPGTNKEIVHVGNAYRCE